MHSLLPVQKNHQENYPAVRVMGSPDTNKAKIFIAHQIPIIEESVFVIMYCNKENKNVDVRPAFRKAIELLGGKGGGRLISAQGWGKNSEAVNVAVNEAVNILKNIIK